MFLNDLYTIDKMPGEENNGKLSFIIRLNSSHGIFEGHFPGNPILPGVCIVQILKELLMVHYDRKLRLKNVSTIKFLSFINPDVNTLIKFDLELKTTGNDDIHCDVSLNFESVTFCRLKGEFMVLP